MAWVYMLECSDGSYYTGWTNDLANRVKVHNAGKGAKYTRSRRPVKIAFASWLEPTEARRMEAQIKMRSRAMKEEIVRTGLLPILTLYLPTPRRDS